MGAHAVFTLGKRTKPDRRISRPTFGRALRTTSCFTHDHASFYVVVRSRRRDTYTTALRCFGSTSPSRVRHACVLRLPFDRSRPCLAHAFYSAVPCARLCRGTLTTAIDRGRALARLVCHAHAQIDCLVSDSNRLPRPDASTSTSSTTWTASSRPARPALQASLCRRVARTLLPSTRLCSVAILVPEPWGSGG